MGHPAEVHVPRFPTWLAILAAALLATACQGGGAGIDTKQLSGRITVRLQNGQAGDPIPQAQVSFVSDTLLLSKTTTGASGRYRMLVMTDVPFGQVHATASGFQPAQATVYFDTPQRRIDLSLRPMP